MSPQQQGVSTNYLNHYETWFFPLFDSLPEAHYKKESSDD